MPEGVATLAARRERLTATNAVTNVEIAPPARRGVSSAGLHRSPARLVTSSTSEVVTTPGAMTVQEDANRQTPTSSSFPSS